MKSGFVSIIGRPNVGKSTLLNTILGRKIAITSNKPQTTRNTIQGVYNDDECQIVFVDTPGIHKPRNILGKHLNKQAYFSLEDVDAVLFLVDVTESLGKGDMFVIDKLKTINKPVILILNKVDKISKEKILPKIEQYMDLFNFTEVIPLSALNNDNVSCLLDVLKKYLSDSVKYYDDEQITNVSKEFIITEFVREKVFNLTDQEVPHSVVCVIESIEERDDLMDIYVNIIVDRENLKKIIIGRNGKMIKEIGTRARKDIENFFNKKVYLNLFVKTIKDWRDKESYLSEFGLKTE
ncbi:MAG: GTPase Era [Bacilli bacterium]|nr:GTPase Era [Bacilli bacterium]MDD4298058.1 GTPase Era [Bacilli bacterium]MDD4644082.1 GTPase Era [Bacilli bacterium]